MLRAAVVAPAPQVSQRTRTLPLTKLRTLDTDGPSEPGRPSFVSSGSGLLVLGQMAYVVPDDENAVAVFDLKKKTPGQWLRVAPGELPVEEHARKGAKRDFESIAALPAFAGHPHGAVLVTPSGSGPQRNVASLIPLTEGGQLATANGRARFQTVDFSRLYARLSQKSPDLNIEGSVLLTPKHGEPVLRLVMRGENGAGTNGFADVSWAKVQKAIASREPVAPSALLRVRKFELGRRDGVRLGLSDVAPLPDGRMVFTAVAEDTKDPVHDGKFMGAAIGVVSAEGKVERVVKVDGYKIEGIHAELEKDGAIKLLLVDDPDDSSRKSTLLSARLPP
jgi:hypothetical protein